MARRPVLRSSLIALAVASAFGSASSALARDETVALSGAQAPGLPAGVSFSTFVVPAQLNNAGQTAFFAGLAGATVDSTNNDVIYRGSTPIARAGDVAPGAAGGARFDIFHTPTINQAGQVAFWGTVGNPLDFINVIYRDTTLIAQTGGFAPNLFPPGPVLQAMSRRVLINDNGQMLFSALVTGGGATSANDVVLYRDTTPIAREGAAAPGTGSGVSLGEFTWFALNNAGATVFTAGLTGTGVTFSNDSAIFSGGTLIARTGDAVPGLPSAFFRDLNFPKINAAGQIAFHADLSGTRSGMISRNGEAVALSGALAPGLAGLTFGRVSSFFGFNDAGQVAYAVPLVGVSAANDDTVWRDATLVAREGGAAPGLGAGVTLGSLTASVALNNAGHVAFHSSLTGTGVGIDNDGALWIGDGVELVNVMREGRMLEGRMVSGLGVPEAGQLNDLGQLVYHVDYVDGSRGLALFTPDLRWRHGASGGWEAANFTLGIAPTPVHDVKLSPNISVTIAGPSTDLVVRSLELGGGSGIATLSLFGGTITTLLGDVRVLANGVLTGDGAVGTRVVNQGTVRAQSLTFLDGLINEGLVAGSGRINANMASSGRIAVRDGEAMRIGGDVGNDTTGRVEVIGGRLEITGTLDSSGRVEVIGGELETGGRLTNSGQLVMRNALAHFSGGLVNFAQVAMSFGTSDVFGDIINAGQIIVSGASNASLYDDVLNISEIRASAGSTIVYFGVLSGSGSLTGAGTHFVEGTLSPGASPGVINAVNLTLGPSSTLLIDINGLEVGTEYDRLVVTGDLVLDGTLSVLLGGGFSPVAGNEFDILDWGTLSGTFQTLNLPALGFNLAWNTSDLYLDGTISVAAIPEPETYALFLAGLGLLAFVARRRSRRNLA